MDVFGDDILFLLDGKTAQDFAGLGGNGSAEDFVLYTKEVMGTNATEDTRGEVKENGRRAGLREIDRVFSDALHPKITASKIILCILHCFARITEKLLQLTAGMIVGDEALGTTNGTATTRIRKAIAFSNE